MATQETTSTVTDSMNVDGLYAIAPGATSNDIYQRLVDRLGHLSSMLMVIYGGGYESFQELNDTIKSKYLWSCSQTAEECERLAELLPIKERQEARAS